jgi:hypothetical protein
VSLRQVCLVQKSLARPSVVLMAADDLESLQAGLIEAVQRIRTLAEDYGVANP